MQRDPIKHHFYALNEISANYHETRARALFGGKAINLVKLLREGLCVPDGFVIPTYCFNACMLDALRQSHGKSPSEIALNIEFSDNFKRELRQFLDETPARRWAVRSSSTDEDSQVHSFAGMQESVIGVSDFDECLDAIRTVWSSFYARERLLYPTQASLSGEVPAMAVVIQGYVDSESAGVIFTHHPMEGSHAMLINVSRGQGANVVDGKESESINIERGQRIDISSECLSNEQIEELTAVALKIEKYYNKPQDIEFSFADGQLYILQSRDIVKHGSEKHVLYSNVNVGEALSGVCTPMTWSLGMSIAELGFETIFSTFGLSVPSSYRFVTTFNGHIYLNISEMFSVMTQIPFIDVSILGRVAGLKQIGEYADIIKPMSRRHFISQLPQSLAHLVSMQHKLKHLPEHAKEFCANRDKLMCLDLVHARHDEVRAAFARLKTLFLDCAYDMLGAAASFLASYVLCSAFLDRFNLRQDESLESYLFSGLLDVQSAAPGLELLNLSNDIREYPALMKAFAEEQSFADIQLFRAKTAKLDGGHQFWKKFDEFMIKYGSRANQEAELANARWREDPSFLFCVICTHLKANKKSETKKIIHATSSERESRTNEFRDMLSRGMRPFFRSILNWAQKNARLREEWRAYVVDALGLYRKFFLSSAERMIEQQLIYSPDDIFYLTYDEFERWLIDPNSLKEAALYVAFRRARHEAYLGTPLMPDTFVTHPNRCGESYDDRMQQRILYGVPASPGTVRARVRVARTLDEAASLEYGEILVTTTTDVGWTPLFLVASAILTERGGPLSHAFVVAREYGVPAVVSIPNLLSLVKTGDVVTVSGQKGIVHIGDVI